MYQAATQATSIDPIISRLRPRSIGEILDQAFRLYRRHFLTFIAIIAVVHVPLQLALQLTTAFLVGGFQNDILNGDLSGSSFTATRTNDLFSYIGVIYLVSIVLGLVYALLQQLSQAALTAEVANSHLDKPVSFGDGYRQMFSRLGPVLGVIFAQLGIVLAILVPVIAIFAFAFAATMNAAFSGSSNSGSGILPLFCFSCSLLIPTFGLLAYVYIRLYLVTPAVMVERIGPLQTIRRSWNLVNGYWWRTFALFLLLAVLGYIVQAGPTAVVQAIVGIFVPRNFVLQQAVSGVISVFTTLVYIPIELIAVTLYYFDLRVRKEGYDIETALAQRYTMPPPPPPYPAWAGAPYGQPTQTTPVMQPPALGQDYSGYGYNYNPGAPTQPVAYQAPEPTLGDIQPTSDDDAERGT